MSVFVLIFIFIRNISPCWCYVFRSYACGLRSLALQCRDRPNSLPFNQLPLCLVAASVYISTCWLSGLPFVVCTHFSLPLLLSCFRLLCAIYNVVIYCRHLQFTTWTNIIFKGGFFGIISLYVRYSTLLPLPPLRFHCVGGCRDLTQNCCDFALTARRSNHSARSHLIHMSSFAFAWNTSFFSAYFLSSIIYSKLFVIFLKYWFDFLLSVWLLVSLGTHSS